MSDTMHRLTFFRPLLEVRCINGIDSIGNSSRKDAACSLQAVSLSVERGIIVGVGGPAGAGKTLLLDCISGMRSIDAGEIWFNGHEISHLRSGYIARMGLVRTFHPPRVFRSLSCLENMLTALPAERRLLPGLFAWPRRADLARATELLAFVGLHDGCWQQAGALPVHQRKRLELAMALMSEPKMLLVDEPVADLDAAGAEDMMELLRRINAELGTTLLVATQDMHWLEGVADYIHWLEQGRVVAAGTPQELGVRHQEPV